MLGFTSCEEDKEPIYQAPTTFELNTPAFENQYIDLATNEGDGTFEIVAKAQPDYGYSAITQYSALVSLTPEFTETVELASTSATQTKMVFKNSDLALAICQLKGIATEEDWAVKADANAIPVYFKGVAQLNGVESSRIVSSNYVALNQVKYYFAVPTPGYIYLIGQCSGWNEPKEANKSVLADWRLFEADDAIGSKVYSGVFNINAGEAMFRFYTELTGWDGGASVGLQEEDSGVVVPESDWSNGSWAGALVKGKGSISLDWWTGGEITIVVDLSSEDNYKVQLMAGSQSVVTPRYIYMVGNNAGWAEPNADNQATYDAWRLVDNSESGVYTATFAMADIADDLLYCRFYQELAGWGAAQWSAAADGSNVEVTSGVAAPTVAGEGCFMLAGVNGHNVTISLDTNANQVTFTIE